MVSAPFDHLAQYSLVSLLSKKNQYLFFYTVEDGSGGGGESSI